MEGQGSCQTCKEAAKLAAAPAGKGKGGGKGNGAKRGVCYFHNTDVGCIKKAKECKFEHQPKLQSLSSPLAETPVQIPLLALRPKLGLKLRQDLSHSPAPLATVLRLMPPVGAMTLRNCQLMHLTEGMVAEFKVEGGSPEAS